MALFYTTVVDNQIKALPTIGTASGSIATFDTDRAERLVNLEVAITATGGGGTPVSPIAINGFSACNLSVNGTTETIPFGQTVYGGRLNVGSGVLTVTHGFDVYNGSVDEVWNVSITEGLYRYNILNNSPYADTIGRFSVDCNIGYFSPVENHLYLIFGYYDGSNKNIYYYPPTGITSVNDFKTWLSNNNLQVKYKLATPLTIQLDSKQIQAIIGTNNIYADCGDIIDLKFILTVGQAIS